MGLRAHGRDASREEALRRQARAAGAEPRAGPLRGLAGALEDLPFDDSGVTAGRAVLAQQHQFSVAQYLAGGHGAPYERLLLLPVLFVAVERRVRANVIRRRTSRVEVPNEIGDKTETQPEGVTAPMEELKPIEQSIPAPLSPEEDSALSATVPEIEMLPEEGISVIPEEELISQNTDIQEEIKSPPAAAERRWP